MIVSLAAWLSFVCQCVWTPFWMAANYTANLEIAQLMIETTVTDPSFEGGTGVPRNDVESADRLSMRVCVMRKCLQDQTVPDALRLNPSWSRSSTIIERQAVSQPSPAWRC